MLYFDLYGKLAVWLTAGGVLGLVLLGFGILYSGRAYRKPLGKDGKPDGHGEPGIPVFLKAVYLAFAVWYIVVTYIVAARGLAI